MDAAAKSARSTTRLRVVPVGLSRQRLDEWHNQLLPRAERLLERALPDSIEFAYATATDVPFLEPKWIARLSEAIGDFDLAIPEAEGYLQPLSALYRRETISPAVRSLLQADRLRPAFLREMVRTTIVDAETMRAVDPKLWTLRNLNTPEDYRRALVDAGFPESFLDEPSK